ERESQVTVDLKPDDDGTILTLTHEQFFNEKARDDHRRGWTAALENLGKIYG
ncbi:MAG: SRPBCC family protein, partial [Reyranella sp.]